MTSKRLVPAVPCKRLHPTHAPSTPVAVRSVIRLLADLSQEIVAPPVSTTPTHHNDASSKGSLSFVFRIRTCSRSCLELFIRRSPPRLFTAAARTGLRPAPENRSRGADPHRSHSFTARILAHDELLSVPLRHTDNLDRIQRQSGRDTATVTATILCFLIVADKR